jgi:signal transduction histidine kinase
MTFGSDAGARTYAPALSPLQDFRGLLIGHLLLLTDVTEQRRAQAQILEQQSSMATLYEREQLARELHDGLGQVLGYIKMQAQAARSLLAQERQAEADRCLVQLASVAQDVHADVREYILQASASSPLELGFSVSLRQYLERFSQNHSIRAELSVSPEMTDEHVEPRVAVQLLRIIQEALANAVKHAHPSQVRVSLAACDGAAQVTIADDGQGFDPGQTRSGGFGLRFMRERAEAVGGSVEVRSAPGQGTRVTVEVPLGKGPVLDRVKDGSS